MFRHLKKEPLPGSLKVTDRFPGYIHLIENPLAQNYLSGLRDKNTTYIDFRNYLEKISLVIAAECAKELSVKDASVDTPLEKTIGKIIYEDIIIMPVLRAGLGLVNGFLHVLPYAKVSHIGIYRDEETLKPVRYYFKFPKMIDPAKTIAYILDPMLATGGSINHAIAALKRQKVNKIIIASLLAAPEGLNEVLKKHKVKIYTCSVDQKLNNKGYIVPGLGDAGDRLYGT